MRIRWMSVLLLPIVSGCASGPTWVPQPTQRPMVLMDATTEDASAQVTSDPLTTLLEEAPGLAQAKASGQMIGASMVYRKSLASVYRILTKPHHTSTLIFPLGEKISGPITGGKEMIRYHPFPEAQPTHAPGWIIAHGYSGPEGAQRLQVDIMPMEAQLQTTLVIRTDGGWYVLEVQSKPKSYYPMVVIQAEPKVTSVAPASTTRFTVPSRGALGMGYDILTPDTQVPAWTPQAVWDDQAVTVFQFGSGLSQGEAPSLYSVNELGARMLVNATPLGRHYLVAHRLSSAWELKLGETVVRIRQSSVYGAKTCPNDPACPTTMAQQASR